jgi:hypothetical protein
MCPASDPETIPASVIDNAPYIPLRTFFLQGDSVYPGIGRVSAAVRVGCVSKPKLSCPQLDDCGRAIRKLFNTCLSALGESLWLLCLAYQ